MRICISAVLSVVAVVTGLAGCQTPSSAHRIASGTIPSLDADSAKAAGLLPQNVHNATKLYTNKCARCHKFYDPASYSSAEWHSWMRKMSKKARLNPDQEELLTRYLDAIRTHNPARNSDTGSTL